MDAPGAHSTLTAADAAFVIETSGLASPAQVELQRLSVDETYRGELLRADALFRRLLNSDGVLSRVSPRLFFEVMLRRAVKELGRQVHVFERSRGKSIPVFSADDVVRLVSNPSVLYYLADMLASFTRVESHTARVFVRRGVMRKTRYSDLDVRSLVKLAQQTEEQARLPLYKRAGDACLLILGIFPDFPATAHRYAASGALRPFVERRGRLSVEEYEAVGARMYGLAAKHPAARKLGIDEPLARLRDGMIDAQRPLNFISEHYLRYGRTELFGAAT